MYVHKGKRGFVVTVRSVLTDGSLGESESFSVYESDKKLSRRELVDLLQSVIDQTNKENKR